MEYEKKYRGGMTNEQFLFYEMRVTAAQMCIEADTDKIFETVREQNLYQFPTERNLKRAFGTCIRRLELLGSDELVRMLSCSSVEVAKQINLYAMMLDNAVVMDFMVEVIGEKYINQDMSFSKKNVNDFLFVLQDKLSDTQSWSDSTITKIRQILVKILVECGYLNDVNSKELNYVYLFPEVEEAIRQNGMNELLPAFNYIE